MSPVQMMDLFSGVSISLASYHAGILRKYDLLRLSETRAVRGVTQHFYLSEVANDHEVIDVLADTEALDREP